MITNTPTSVHDPSDAAAQLNERLLLVLARLRAAGTPQWLVAAQAKVNPTLLSLWVNGRRQPSLHEAERVAGVLGLEVAELWPDLLRNEGEATTAA